ncbi:MAG: cytochrome c [Gemmatimonadota bacterium]|nr:cytochrome c [Gemmatimonadota bacterium]
MHDSSRAHRSAPGSPLALVTLLALVSGCGPPDDSGYDKLVFRERDAVPRAAAPTAPPVIAGLGETSETRIDFAAVNFPAGVTAEMAEQGQELYATVCVACHAAGGAGGPLAPALNDGQWIHIAGEFPEIVNLVRSGVPAPEQYPSPMPPMGGASFDDAQLRAVAAYVFALSHGGGA